MKRQNRYSYPPRKRAKIDKQLIPVQDLTTAGVQAGQSINSPSYPCTTSGLLWNVTFSNTSNTDDCFLIWAIVKVEEGDNPGALNLTSSPFYAPEDGCLVFGSTMLKNTAATNGSSHYTFTGKTKIKRNMMPGDHYYFIWLTTEACDLVSTVQFFNTI